MAQKPTKADDRTMSRFLTSNNTKSKTQTITSAPKRPHSEVANSSADELQMLMHELSEIKNEIKDTIRKEDLEITVTRVVERLLNNMASEMDAKFMQKFDCLKMESETRAAKLQDQVDSLQTENEQLKEVMRKKDQEMKKMNELLKQNDYYSNPGIVGYYEEFMDKLYTLSNKRLPVWAVSHAGHVKIPKELEIQASSHDPFNLEGQIQHKMDFLRNHVPKDVNIILIGHSIGCYIILQLMNRLPDLNIHRAIMLFPTIERMALSPQGRIATPFLRYFRWIARGAAYFLSFLPQNLQRKLIIWHLADDNLPECAIESSLNLVDHFCLGNVMYMANTEMNEVTDLHVDIIRAHLKKLTFYMGLTDAWCPVEYYEGMKERFPDGDIKLCQVGYEHAFVLAASEPVAQLTWSWLEKDVSEKINAD
ncbi:lipid droplet-associated hydrolase-like [Lingula anatina]|uniref:Lipid droplet-associated hydrolase n=1 Tax=Lingula anatina TaxID=7574 RepID=A0A1S3IBN4_LINAN|nr:lipid droplet-associated hydrolase-like [Lingula anatina]|eukprot:XP_013395271.1 lipid droplet-associated hydrolase-like [Lingula anatina]